MIALSTIDQSQLTLVYPEIVAPQSMTHTPG